MLFAHGLELGALRKIDVLPHPDDCPQRPSDVGGLNRRLPRDPWIVANAFLDNPEVPFSSLRDQLRVDEEIARLDRDLVDYLATKELECAVDVANSHPEEDIHDPVVDPREDRPQDRVVAIDAEPNDDVRVLGDWQEPF